MPELAVCAYCSVTIEQSEDGTWWQLGTCGAECLDSPGPENESGFRGHEPRLPDLDDLEEVEQWLEQ